MNRVSRAQVFYFSLKRSYEAVGVPNLNLLFFTFLYCFGWSSELELKSVILVCFKERSSFVGKALIERAQVVNNFGRKATFTN